MNDLRLGLRLCLRRSMAPANFLGWRRKTSAFDGLAAFDDFAATLIGPGGP